MCNSSVHWLKVVVGGQRSLFENQWAEPIKRSLYLKGSFPKALSSFTAEIYVRKMPAGQRWTFASMWNIFRGSFEKPERECYTGFQAFCYSVIFSKEGLLVCLILYFVIENFPDCFPCTSHHLPLGAGQGNLRWNCNYSQILIQKPYLLTNTKTKKLQFRPNTNEKDFNYSHLQIWWDRFNQGDSPSTISPTVTLAGINEMWD